VHTHRFNDIWDNILSHEGKIFHTISGKEFSYKINNCTIIPSRTKYNISKNNIEKAFDLLPLNGPGDISKIVRGSSYVWAILNDNRIISGYGV
jgi:hypothetical protein